MNQHNPKRTVMRMPMRQNKEKSMSSLEDSPLFITALSKGLAILTAFRAGRPSMSLVELAEHTGLNKALCSVLPSPLRRWAISTRSR